MFFRSATIYLLLHLFRVGDCSHSAFCAPNINDSKLFPLDAPSSALKLWPWDAVHDDARGTVEVTVIQRRACQFNHSIWQRLVTLFPHQVKYIAHGNISNVLVNSNATRLAAKEFVLCYFYKNGVSTPIAQTRSQVITGLLHFLRVGTTQIICPSPRQKFDTMRLVRIARNIAPNPTRKKYNSAAVKVATDAFPVCDTKTLKRGSNQITDRDSEERKEGRLSVCTATGRNDRARLVEWIEYHRLIGVDHFYIYDTSRQQGLHSVSSALSDYVSEGVVTVVPWGYENCVRGMGGGRFVTWRDAEEWGQVFKPPKAIAQSAALASCYSRYRSHTEYMMHIDDDEFIAMGSSVLKKGPGLGYTQSNLLYNGHIYRPLAEYVDQMFRARPEVSAIAFPPLRKHACPILEDNARYARVPTGLPRIGEWLYARQMGTVERKLVMRTSTVRMFYVHYVSQLEKGLHDYGAVMLNLTEFAVLHYKEPAEMTGDIFGPADFGAFKKGSVNHYCREMKRFGGLKEDVEGGYFPAPGQPATPTLHNQNYTNIIQSIGPEMVSILAVNSKIRMMQNMSKS